YSRDRAIELVKRNSRRYAKRQRTWFREYHAVGTSKEVTELVKLP
ncbi:MAG: tRNA (adenosine(37)-N6)-dimethylallyltransferase MiaA, partial [Lewinella sp.]